MHSHDCRVRSLAACRALSEWTATLAVLEVPWITSATRPAELATQECHIVGKMGPSFSSTRSSMRSTNRQLLPFFMHGCARHKLISLAKLELWLHLGCLLRCSTLKEANSAAIGPPSQCLGTNRLQMLSGYDMAHTSGVPPAKGI